jgi:glycerophosphoryl diester phosphodiesterase
LRSATVRELAMQGVPVLLYTVNDAARAARLLQAGARGIITDAPDRILPLC